jgi:hypothetical protein
MILQVQAGGGVEVRKKWLLRGSTSIQKRGGRFVGTTA